LPHFEGAPTVKFKSPVYSQASGSIAGITYSHNRGGLYTRARAIPVNSQTQQQQTVRNFVSTLTALWTNTLTTAQRAGWETYALNTNMVDSLGEPRNIGGLAHYVRSNVPRLQSSKTRIDTAPSVFGLAVLSTIAAIADVSDQNFQVAFSTADEWAKAAGGHLFVFQSRPVNPGINYFKGPYRLIGAVNGNTTPPTTPATIDAVFPFTLAQKVFLYGRASEADGRLSAPFRVTAIMQA
jgi:hypothetical protein